MLYDCLLGPLLFHLPPESAHHLALKTGQWIEKNRFFLNRMAGLYAPESNPRLSQEFFGCRFDQPLGLAAGFDKNIQLTGLMRTLGFGFEEAGSISVLPWPGNPKPRLFRLKEDEALINRMGLNNHGISQLLPTIQGLSNEWPIGLSLVKTPDPSILEEKALADFGQALRQVYGYGAYLSLNISCPNTEEGKTFEEPEALETLLRYLRTVEQECYQETARHPKPWLLKISPDISPQQLQELYEIGHRYQIAGWIATNTTGQRDNLQTNSTVLAKIGRGGLSGKPLRQRSTQLLGNLYQLSQSHADPMVLMGVGGINNVESAWEKITHGAALLQLYTGLIYHGPGLLKTIHHGLIQKLEEHRLAHIQDAVGLAFR